MSLYFDNFGGSGRSAWTRTLPPPAQAGRAQPVQPQSQGTPYGQQPDRRALSAAPRAQDFAAYQPRPTQQAPANPFAQYNPQQMGNFAQQQMGLPSFQFTATDPFGNTYNNPAALTAQQGAMAQALNAQRAQQVQSGNFGPLNPMAAYQQAQNMVQGGWTNPFAPPSNGQFGTMGGPRSDPRWSHNGGQWQSGQAQPIQPPSQGTPYGTPPDQRGQGRTAQFIDRDQDGVDDRDQDGPGMPRYGQPTRRGTFERDAVGMPILRAPQVWTNPSDPEWLKRELQSKPDTRPVVWDEANRRYIKNPYLAGGPARPDAAAPLQRYEPGFAYARR